MPPLVTRTEYLEINSVALSTPAYWLRSLVPLKEGPKTRGANRLVPAVKGRTAYKPYTDETRVLLPIVIVGQYDNSGAAIANPKDGLQDNIDYLLTNVVLTADAGGAGTASDGTRSATWHLPDGSTTRTANVQVLGLDLAPLGKSSVQGALDIVIPAGRFA